jgi:hypothetical protein
VILLRYDPARASQSFLSAPQKAFDRGRKALDECVSVDTPRSRSWTKSAIYLRTGHQLDKLLVGGSMTGSCPP